MASKWARKSEHNVGGFSLGQLWANTMCLKMFKAIFVLNVFGSSSAAAIRCLRCLRMFEKICADSILIRQGQRLGKFFVFYQKAQRRDAKGSGSFLGQFIM
jgi:hypothetical protein